MSFFVEETNEGKRVYRTKVLHPKNLRVLGSELALKILAELAKKPQSAMDIARKLKQHEQKIYYHIRRLAAAGIIQLERTEERVGAVAKIFSILHPYVATKLFDGEHLPDVKTKAAEIDFFRNFVRDGKLDATIVVGSPDPHGKYGAQASDGSAAIDLALFLGTFLNEAQPNYKLDTELREEELKNNLIVVGGPKANIVIDKINTKLPIYFDTKRDFDIVSSITKSIYTGDEVGILVKMKNPFNKNKEVLVISGKRFKGTRAAILALIKYFRKIRVESKNDFVAKVVRGIDRDADGKIDDVEFLE
jgi:DNA-binding transcriptional ArsR family regulator